MPDPTLEPVPAAATATPIRRPALIAGLLVLNAALLAGVGVLAWSPGAAIAQGPAPTGATNYVGDYTMLAGRVDGRTGQDAVYIIDTRTMTCIPFIFSTGTNRFEVFEGRTMSRDVPDDRQRR